MQTNHTLAPLSDPVVLLAQRHDETRKKWDRLDEFEQPDQHRDMEEAWSALDHEMANTPAASLAGVLEKLRIVAKAPHDAADLCLDDLLLRGAIADLERMMIGINAITS